MEEYKPPVISMLGGRLGNCMFQIAAGQSYAKEYGRPYFVFFNDSQPDNPDFDYILSNYKRTYSLPDERIEWREFSDFSYNKIPAPIREDMPVLIYGYFADERYFDRDDVNEWFKAPEGMKEHVFNKYGDLSDCVSINVRRGDYVELGIALDADWYLSAYHNFFEGKRAFITGDDIEWAKENINIPNAIYSHDSNPIEDLYATSFCKDHICYNGTFGWWASYLGEKEDSKIVVKSGYFKSLPYKWIEY